MPLTTTALLPAAVQQSFSHKLLSIPVPNMIHKTCATKKRMPKNGGTILRQKRYNSLQTALVPLGNGGITPPGQALGEVFIDAEMKFYGTYVAVNEQVTLQSNDPVLNATTKLLGVSLRQTEDALARDTLRAGAGMINCVSGVNADIPTELTYNDVQNVVTTLLDSNAYTISDNIDAANKYGTGPVRDAYFCMSHARLSRTIENAGDFLHKSQYASPMNALRSEWGAIGNVRFLLSSVGSIDPAASLTGGDVFNNFICGMEAYGCIEQDGYSAQYIYRPPIYDGPLALNCSVGYKFAEVDVIENDAWIANLRCTSL